MKLTVQQLDAITGSTNYAGRKVALARLVNENDLAKPIRAPHALAQFLAQVMHESAGLKYVKEVWGPTKAQRGYEGRLDLGNSQKGDGKRFMGRDVIQITGRANYRALTAWLRERGFSCPDFEKHPESLQLPEYLGLGALWYWLTRIPARYIASGNIEMITRRVNGGLNGYSDRLRYYDRAALILLGYGVDGVRQFQADQQIIQDGIVGPVTRGRLHSALLKEGQKPAPITQPDPQEEPPKGIAHALLAIFAAIFGGKK
jgi:putative chitinase